MSVCNHKDGAEMYAAKNPESCHQCRQLVAAGIPDRMKSGELVVAKIWRQQ